MSTTARLNKLHKTIIKQAHDGLRNSIESSFAAATVAANDSVVIRGVTAPKLIGEVKAALFKARVKQAEEDAIQAFLDKHEPVPVLALDRLINPRMVHIGPDGEPMADDAKGHVAVLLPDFGLMYDARPPVEVDNWQEAVDAATKCDLLGHRDWQLWNDKEAELVIDRRFSSPAINKAHFPNTPTNRIWWTRTEHASSSGGAFYVGFGDGNVGWYYRNREGFARFVRRVAARQ